VAAFSSYFEATLILAVIYTSWLARCFAESRRSCVRSGIYAQHLHVFWHLLDMCPSIGTFEHGSKGFFIKSSSAGPTPPKLFTHVLMCFSDANDLREVPNSNQTHLRPHAQARVYFCEQRISFFTVVSLTTDYLPITEKKSKLPARWCCTPPAYSPYRETSGSI
jgi:hypothetical protein